MSTATEISQKEILLVQLKGWAGALVKVIDEHTPELLDGGSSTNPKDLEVPRDKVRRLVCEIVEIQQTIEQKVFGDKLSFRERLADALRW